MAGTSRRQLAIQAQAAPSDSWHRPRRDFTFMADGMGYSKVTGLGGGLSACWISLGLIGGRFCWPRALHSLLAACGTGRCSWLKALGKTAEDLQPSLVPFVISFFAALLRRGFGRHHEGLGAEHQQLVRRGLVGVSFIAASMRTAPLAAPGIQSGWVLYSILMPFGRLGLGCWFGFPNWNSPLPRLDTSSELRAKLLEFCRLQSGDIWVDAVFGHRVGCLDATDANAVGSAMDGDVAQLAIQEPPYNLAAFELRAPDAFIDWCLISTEAALARDSSLYDQKNGILPG